MLFLPGDFIWSFYLSFISGHAESVYRDRDVTLAGLPHTDTLTITPQLDSLYDCHGQQQPFELKLGAPNLLRLFSCILQEKQIVVVAADANRCVYFCQTLLSLLRPFSWQFLYAPNLPSQLFDAVDSFMPYIVGVPSHHFKQLQERYDLREKVVVDIDRDTLVLDEETFVPLPQRLHCWLLACFTAEVHYMPPVKRELRIKKNCLKMMLALLGDFLSAFERDPLTHSVAFHQNQYMRIVRREELSFYHEFMGKTMMFRRLLEQVENLLSDTKAH